MIILLSWIHDIILSSFMLSFTYLNISCWYLNKEAKKPWMLKHKRLTCIFGPRLKRSRTGLPHADAVPGQHSKLIFHPSVQIHHRRCPSVPVNHLRDWEQTEKPRLNRNDLAYTLKSTIEASSWANVYSKPGMSQLENRSISRLISGWDVVSMHSHYIRPGELQIKSFCVST